MKGLKYFDAVCQVFLLLVWAWFFIGYRDNIALGYISIGTWQLTSAAANLLIRRYRFTKFRIGYYFSLLFFAFLTACVRDIGPIFYIWFCLPLLMAVYYCTVCVIEARQYPAGAEPAISEPVKQENPMVMEPPEQDKPPINEPLKQ